jgi:SSS family solute:Na+ symporter
VGAGVITFAFQFRGITPLGLGAGVWSLITATVLFVLVSLFTPAPKKADKFINYINENLKQRNAI